MKSEKIAMLNIFCARLSNAWESVKTNSHKGKVDFSNLVELIVALVMFSSFAGLIIIGFNSTSLGLTGITATAANTVVPLVVLVVAVIMLLDGTKKVLKG